MTTSSEPLTAGSRRTLPTSTCWSSAPASPASTSSTGRSRRASPCSCVEAGDGVGGTWYWNRYPGARFDSESYTYGYLFSQELFDEWEWQEHFAAQPETERYLNHVVDRFDLRRHMRFGAPVTVRRLRRAVGHVGRDARRRRADDAVRARFLVAATGVLSVPYIPDVPGRDDFRGVQHHTGRWPASPSTSPASGWRSSAPRRAACRWCRRSSTRSRRSPSTSAPPTGARRSTTRRSPPRSRRSSGPTSSSCARC